MGDTRKRKIKVNDRISELPDNLIDIILDHLPVDDVVRTSILSRKWKHHWRRAGNLVFDKKFAEIVQKNSKEPIILNDYGWWRFVDAVCSLLLLHDGPINTFSMYLSFFKFGHIIDIDGILCEWMHALSLHGVKDFTLDANDELTLALPSYIFDCLEMRRLALHRCKVSLPFNIRGFKNLISLRLDHIWISGSALNTLISNCLLLEELFLHWIDGGSFIVRVCAPNLRKLEVESANIKALLLQNVPILATLSITYLQPEVADEYAFTSLFGAIPNVTDLTLCGHTLTAWGTHGFPKMLPTPLDILNNLSIFSLNLAGPRQMYGAICIIRSSPNLQRLYLSILPLLGNEMAEADSVTFLHELFTEPKYFPSNLSTVTIAGLMGARPHILLPKYILTSCPSLEILDLNADADISREAELQMMDELLECHRASSKAKITYIKGQGKSAMRYTMTNV